MCFWMIVLCFFTVNSTLNCWEQTMNDQWKLALLWCFRLSTHANWSQTTCVFILQNTVRNNTCSHVDAHVWHHWTNMELESNEDPPSVHAPCYSTLPVACRNIPPSLSSHHSPPPPVPFTSLYSTLSRPPPSLPVPTSNSLSWTNPGGLSHRWVWLGAYLCMALPEVLSPVPRPSPTLFHLSSYICQSIADISKNAALLSFGWCLTDRSQRDPDVKASTHGEQHQIRFTIMAYSVCELHIKELKGKKFE